MKVFLEKKRSKFSNNVERSINLDLSTKTRLLPNDNIIDNFSLFEQYNRERDKCEKYRIILNINPICSNVLFNARTEIVVNEGSSACTLLIGDNKKLSKSEYAENAVNTLTDITYMDAIRNTEYSHKENGRFIYHCGYDIFNNHMLRKNSFIHVNKLDENGTCGDVYNTIFDYCRDGRGNIVKEDICVKNSKKETRVDMHLYQYDTIMSMPLAFMDNCIEKDGWWGFTNPNTIEIPNNSGTVISINRMMANNKSCEFIDLYPDRSLFSFVPKFNKFKRRLEYNWDYCLTYPYKVDYDYINKVCGGEKQSIRANVKLSTNSAGNNVVECSSYFKHNLKPGNYVTFFYYMPHYEILDIYYDGELTYVNINDGEYLYSSEDINFNGEINSGSTPIKIVRGKEFMCYGVKVKVDSIGDANGDNKEKIFNVKYDDINDIYEHMSYFGCFFKKNNGNNDCVYYFRKFKKLKAINGDKIRSEINKVAFGQNIYGDDTSQIIFTDDVDLSNILDHNGKPVSEIFLTVIKRNAGRKEWYENNNFSGDTVEMSHCFGKVTSGVDFSGIDNEPFDYNIHYLHNMDSKYSFNFDPAQKNTFSAWGETILSGMPKTIEDDITIDYDEFYGDIVEYDIYKATETVIGNVFHRFNTEQRETWNKDYRDIKHDVIISDDYDYANGSGQQFTIETYFLNNFKTSLDKKGTSNDLIYGNISPEGYFYNPHTRIKVREDSDIESTSPAKYINYSEIKISTKKTYLLFKNDGSIEIYNSYDGIEENKEEGEEYILQSYYYELKFDLPLEYSLYKGDHICFYDKITTTLVWGEIINNSDGYVTLKIDGEDLDAYDSTGETYFDPYSGARRFYAYWSPNNTPTYAKLCEGARKFIWRDIVSPSKMMRDDELFDLPFTNGCFYIEKNINFFLKRQDPIGKYGLSMPMYKTYTQQLPNPLVRFGIKGNNPIDFSDMLFTLNNFGNTCY